MKLQRWRWVSDCMVIFGDYQNAYEARNPLERTDFDNGARLLQEASDAYQHRAMATYVQASMRNVFARLESGETKFERYGLSRAVPDYQAAIRQADNIDQSAVAKEREYLRQALVRTADPYERRSLLQEDEQLHDLQRAPGVARANLGLLLIRNGYQMEGTNLLLEAQSLDPEMNRDPNFKRHLLSAQQAAHRLDSNFTAQQNYPAQELPAYTINQTRPQSGANRNPAFPFDDAAARSYTVPTGDGPASIQPWRMPKPDTTPMAQPAPLQRPTDAQTTLPDSSPVVPWTPQWTKPQNSLPAEKQPPATNSQPAKVEAQSDDQAKRKFNELLATANAHKSDMLSAKQYYEQAIKQADALYDPVKTKQTIEKLENALETGKYKDDSGAEHQVTVQDRLDAHQAIVTMLDSARAPFMARMIYANELKRAHEYGDAEKVMLELRLVTDKLPIEAIKKEANLLKIDSARPGMPPGLQKQWNDAADSLKEMAMSPIRSRYDLIRFYLAGGKTPEGGTVGDVYLDDNKKTVTVDTKILKPEKAAEIINETVKREKELLGFDLEKEPGLDQNLLQLRELARFNSPKNLKQTMHTMSSYWPDVTSDVVAGAVGIGITLGALWLARYGGSAAAAEGTGLFASALETAGSAASWMGKPGAIATGLLASVGTRHVMKKDLFNDQDETWTNSFFHGATAYAAIGSMYLAKDKLSNYFFKDFSADKIGERAMDGLAPSERTVGGLARALSAHGMPLPEALSDAVSAGRSAEQLTAQSAGELLESSGQQGATLLRAVFGKVGVYTPEQLGGTFLEKLPESQRTVGGMAEAFRQAGVTLPKSLAAALQAPGAAERVLTPQLATELFDQVGQSGANVLTEVFGKGAAAIPGSGLSGWLGRVPSTMQSFYKPISADVLPVSSQISPFAAARLAVGTGSALTFNTINTLGNSLNDWRNGAELNGERVNPLNTFQRNAGKILLDSVIGGVVLGGVSPVSTGVSPFTAFSNARCLGTGPFASCSIAVKSAISGSGLPFAEADLGQRLGQVGWTSFWGSLPLTGRAFYLNEYAKTYEELLRRTTAPISNELPQPIVPARASILS